MINYLLNPILIFLLSRSVGIMAKLSYHLPPNALLTLYHSLVHVHLIYALPVWAITFPTYLIKLKRLQNKAIRIITKTSPKDRILPHYCRLQILKLDDLNKFEVAKLMYQFTHKKYQIYSANILHIPIIFLNTQLVIRLITIYIFPQFSSNRTQRSIKYVGTKIWNNIPGRFTKFSYLNLNIFTKNTS